MVQLWHHRRSRILYRTESCSTAPKGGNTRNEAVVSMRKKSSKQSKVSRIDRSKALAAQATRPSRSVSDGASLHVHQPVPGSGAAGAAEGSDCTWHQDLYYDLYDCGQYDGRYRAAELMVMLGIRHRQQIEHYGDVGILYQKRYTFL